MINWNGLSMLRNGSEKPDFCIQTDASGFWGCAAYFSGRWFQLSWVKSWQDANILAKELLPIVLSTAIWSPPYPLTRYCINVIIAVLVWWLQSTETQLGT